MNPIFLTLEEVLEIHGHQIELHGGDPGIRDLDLHADNIGLIFKTVLEEGREVYAA